jgi:TRAP-type mannitol/chloroaromatic compound transport system substrate-binding protein
LKHYYLQGLHQVVVNGDIYFNGDKWNKLTLSQQQIIEAAADATIMRNLTKRIYDNGVALEDLVNNQGVILHDTPKDYFAAFMNEAKNVLESEASKNAFFNKVWQSQKDFAKIAVPYWAEAQTSNASLGKAYANSLKK